MRLAIAGLYLESVSFLPVLTTIADFSVTELAGPALVEQSRGTNTVCGGFVDVAEREGVALVPLVYAEGGAAGPATDDAFLHYADRICAGLIAAGPVDGVLLALHGAMTTSTRLDPDREIVERVRAIVGRRVPIVVALDYHANVDDQILRVADAVFGFHFSPHTDVAATGRRAAECLLRILRGELRPCCAIARPGVMVPSIFSATGIPPLSSIVAQSLAMAETAPGYLDVSVFAGFSYADVPNCGFSVVAVADNQARAAEAAELLSRRVYAERHALLHAELVMPLDAGVSDAIQCAATARKPVVLLEHADRMNDSTHVLHALLRHGAQRAAVPFLWDPQAAAEAERAGAGARITVDVGGRSSARAGGPVTLTGTVLFAGEKEFRMSGPYMQGKRVMLGMTALIDTGGVLVSVVSQPAFGVDEEPFRIFGLDPRDFRIIVLRSKTHFRAVYETLAERIIIVDTPDWGPADLTTLPYRQVPTERTFPFTDLTRP
jgi:microcystin degradation protein MlrC